MPSFPRVQTTMGKCFGVTRDVSLRRTHLASQNRGLSVLRRKGLLDLTHGRGSSMKGQHSGPYCCVASMKLTRELWSFHVSWPNLWNHVTAVITQPQRETGRAACSIR